MRNVLKVADIFAGIEIKRHERLSVQIVARSNRAVEARRRIADHEVDALACEIDCWVLPDGAAQGSIRITGLGELGFFRRNVTVHLPASGIVGCPHTDWSLRN